MLDYYCGKEEREVLAKILIQCLENHEMTVITAVSYSSVIRYKIGKIKQILLVWSLKLQAKDPWIRGEKNKDGT